ncbi:hypothetical protein [Natrinema marinum]|uniref:hypothetical protein n=1 Tax=Natrinema marinum TaxID=2961598 RepID=UPI0020C84C59|nr:hypothetical protein [Natrinema marinum]
MRSYQNGTRRRLLRYAGSVGALGLAGCLSDSIDDPETDGDDDSEPPALAFPPGLTADGLTDPAALLEAHRDAVTKTSFTAIYTAHRPRTYRGGSETAWVQEALDIWAEPEAERVEKVTYEYDSRGERERDSAVYIDGDRGATTGLDSVTQRSADSVIEAALEPIGNWVRRIEGEYDGTATIGTERVHRISVTGIDGKNEFDDEFTAGGTVLVDGTGRIRSVRLRQAETADGSSDFSVEFDCDDLGETTVVRPEWADELEPAGITAIELEPGTAIDLSAEIPAWVGLAPEPIAGLENPPLALESGESYTIGWSEGDGAAHNLQLRDENGDVVNGLETEVTTDPAGEQRLEFVASDELASYACEPHAPLMNGDIEVR